MDKRKVGCILACLLGGLLYLYLGGLLGQLIMNYEDWLSQDGMLSGAIIETVRAEPFFCFRSAFTGHGIKALCILGVGVGGLAIYLKLGNRFGGKAYDPRDFKRSKAGTYGTAGWMEVKEMQQVLEVVPPGKAKGTILGAIGGNVICLPANSRLNQHIAIIGASGTGKSRGFIRNHVLQAVRRGENGLGESLILTDPKCELYSDMSEYLRQNGYQVRVFNLVDPLHSDSWNCMAGLHGDTLMAQVLTDVIINNTSDGKGDHFWDNGEGNLLKALILYVDQSTAYGPERKNLPEVYRFLTQTNERELNSLFDRLPVNHPAKAPYNLYRQSSDTVRSGILLGLGTRLQVLQNEKVKRITSRSDIDLIAPARSKCAYFVILSDQDSSMDFLSSLFFSVLFIRLVRTADVQPSGRCPITVNLILDEFNNIGTIGGGGGQDFARAISTFRSRGLNISLCIQSLPQIQNRYPNNLWAEILGNCDTQIMLGCTDEATATFTANRAGDMTVEVNSTMTTRQTFALAQVIPQYRYSEGLGRRKLLTPDEVLRLPNEELLVMLRGQKVLKAGKFDYSRHPAAKQLKRSSILDYSTPTLYSESMSAPVFEPAAAFHKPPAPSVGALYETSSPPADF